MQLIYLLLRMLLLGPLYGTIVTLAILGTKHKLHSFSPAIVGNLHYGANYIHAKHLAIWYFVRTNAELDEARKNGLEQDVQAITRHLLAHYGYPQSALSEVHINIESRQNIDKGGGERYYFQ